MQGFFFFFSLDPLLFIIEMIQLCVFAYRRDPSKLFDSFFNVSESKLNNKNKSLNILLKVFLFLSIISRKINLKLLLNQL